MNDTQLDQLLKSARVPERAPQHWESMPRKIITKLHWQEHPADNHSTSEPRRRALPFLGLGIASACLVLLLAFTFWKQRGVAPAPTDAFAGVEKCYREIHEMFPNQIQAIILTDEHSRIELAETANQSDAQPIFLKICGPNGCQRIITFSGQRIRVGGEECDVLANGAGGVIVAGEKSLWTSEEPSKRLSQYRIVAKQLKSS